MDFADNDQGVQVLWEIFLIGFKVSQQMNVLQTFELLKSKMNLVYRKTSFIRKLEINLSTCSQRNLCNLKIQDGKISEYNYVYSLKLCVRTYLACSRPTVGF